jgi:hypothetical protein
MQNKQLGSTHLSNARQKNSWFQTVKEKDIIYSKLTNHLLLYFTSFHEWLYCEMHCRLCS